MKIDLEAGDIEHLKELLTLYAQDDSRAAQERLSQAARAALLPTSDPELNQTQLLGCFTRGGTVVVPFGSALTFPHGLGRVPDHICLAPKTSGGHFFVVHLSDKEITIGCERIAMVAPGGRMHTAEGTHGEAHCVLQVTHSMIR